VSEVPLDRLRAQEELSSNLAIRLPLRDDQHDLDLLRCELVRRSRVSPTEPLIGRAQLRTRSLCPGVRLDTLEHGERGAQFFTRGDPVAARSRSTTEVRS
jgi:hypothetical protein